MRLSVAAKIALATAGTIAEVPGSPIPPGGFELWTIWTSIAGASLIRGIWISVEVGLLDTAVLERDSAVERSRDAKDDRALDLRPDDIGIDHNAAIDRADDARPLPSRPSCGSSSIRPPS